MLLLNYNLYREGLRGLFSDTPREISWSSSHDSWSWKTFKQLFINSPLAPQSQHTSFPGLCIKSKRNFFPLSAMFHTFRPSILYFFTVSTSFHFLSFLLVPCQSTFWEGMPFDDVMKYGYPQFVAYNRWTGKELRANQNRVFMSGDLLNIPEISNEANTW